MNRSFVFLYVLFLSMIAIDIEAKEAKKNLRILELLPNLVNPLPVSPYLPANFIALSPSGHLDPYDWIYWGPRKVLKKYFKNPLSLKMPILRVKLSSNVVQTGPNSFNGKEHLQFIDVLKKEYPKEFASMETKWGKYPAFIIKAKMDGEINFTAWVGLNDREGGWTLLFNLVYPKGNGRPNELDCKLWENFFTKTTPLSGGEYFRALGQDYKDGYTILDINGSKLKMIAEKREHDGTIQLVVIPKHKDIQFEYDNMLEGLMAEDFRKGEPLVKVKGKIELTRGKAKYIDLNKSILIFYKTVSEFSHKQEDGEDLLIFQKEKAKDPFMIKRNNRKVVAHPL